ncbi:MAG: 3-deoxy-7-phosphoheptulonate synthase [Elusimicrobia bacterium]|nr:3-deoxy-7-phosphoheptulonate synthase [Elusimicrobiota bacterium]
MAFKYRQRIPDADAILKQMPLPGDLAGIKRQRDREVIDIMTGKSRKFLLVIGPCSAESEDPVCEYVARLARVQDKVKDRLVLVPRIYTNKPRTTGIGYKGMAHQPDPNEDPNIVEGILAIRRMHIRVLRESGLSSADEMLYPGNYPYLEDVLTYVAVGARSVENQEHRLTVSGLDIPVGMKNPTGGDIMVMINSVRAAQSPHIFAYKGWEVETNGNPLIHAILRGAIDPYGRCVPNYHFEDIVHLKELYEKAGLVNPGVVIDVSHANSNRDFREQPRVAVEALHSRKYSEDVRAFVKGLMIESYLIEGRQDPPGKVCGQSITDACLGWEASEDLILRIADMV